MYQDPSWQQFQYDSPGEVLVEVLDIVVAVVPVDVENVLVAVVVLVAEVVVVWVDLVEVDVVIVKVTWLPCKTLT